MTPDTKFFDRRRKKVLNKHARFNLCFAEIGQKAAFDEGKGTIISYSDVKHLKHLRSKLPDFFGPKAEGLACEGNYYYDVTKCGIGFHGDSERKRVIGVRLGASIPLHFQWFKDCKPIGKRVKIILKHGDMYVMSEKATGNDWKQRSKATLRHAAGSKKYLTIK